MKRSQPPQAFGRVSFRPDHLQSPQESMLSSSAPSPLYSHPFSTDDDLTLGRSRSWASTRTQQRQQQDMSWDTTSGDAQCDDRNKDQGTSPITASAQEELLSIGPLPRRAKSATSAIPSRLGKMATANTKANIQSCLSRAATSSPMDRVEKEKRRHSSEDGMAAKREDEYAIPPKCQMVFHMKDEVPSRPQSEKKCYPTRELSRFGRRTAPEHAPSKPSKTVSFQEPESKTLPSIATDGTKTAVLIDLESPTSPSRDTLPTTPLSQPPKHTSGLSIITPPRSPAPHHTHFSSSPTLPTITLIPPPSPPLSRSERDCVFEPVESSTLPPTLHTRSLVAEASFPSPPLMSSDHTAVQTIDPEHDYLSLDPQESALFASTPTKSHARGASYTFGPTPSSLQGPGNPERIQWHLRNTSAPLPFSTTSAPSSTTTTTNLSSGPSPVSNERSASDGGRSDGKHKHSSGGRLKRLWKSLSHKATHGHQAHQAMHEHRVDSRPRKLEVEPLCQS
ncbi:hypothetical protein MVEG_11205 [Podila verticillata NRRL 6337]|uniref:Uncharacterized protein n=1 Tax=Podila verticillata NRRL 6337 TaxID=1069443 RepID=A0A086TMJ3_9FUNG|nr:hypothetical protein MVEG_11205 [Podila verticillata NRRL 6337]